ncbi:MAG TPA: hypothetical protein PLJ16_02810 [Casimicrobium huifangae]|nr:hypothetical protein [Casimicrobium huifangae]
MALIVWAVQQVRVLDARMETVQAREKLAIAQTAAVAQARKKEREWQAQADAIAAKYVEDLAGAEETHRAVVADLERGAVRLRAHWQGCQATAELSAAAESAARADEASRLREQAAARIVRVGAECDAHVRGLQGVVMASRQVKDGNEQ